MCLEHLNPNSNSSRPPWLFICNRTSFHIPPLQALHPLSCLSRPVGDVIKLAGDSKGRSKKGQLSKERHVGPVNIDNGLSEPSSSEPPPRPPAHCRGFVIARIPSPSLHINSPGHVRGDRLVMRRNSNSNCMNTGPISAALYHRRH